MTEPQDTDMLTACDHAARVLTERRALLASRDPADQARAHRLTLALAELIAADSELTEQETAAAPKASPLLEGFAAAWRPNTPNT